ncbi:MAG: hypothetical protein WKF48_05680 [Solirubrobacteraceae bacterium]
MSTNVEPGTVAELLVLAGDVGVTLDEPATIFLLRARGRAATLDLVAGAGALMTLAGALKQGLGQAAAFRKMDAAGGDYDRAVAPLLERERRRRERRFGAEWARLERALYEHDAKARHAVFVGHLAGGSLGWQTSMLLQAADDASLSKPDAWTLRVRLSGIVGAEINRRFPVRREAEWMVVGEDHQKHAELVREQIRAEQQARDLVLGRRPELAQRIDALRSAQMVKDVEAVLRSIRKRLSQRAEQGWVADPERYQREVVESAAEAARQAS